MKYLYTSVGNNTTGWQSKLEPTSRTIAVNSLPPSRKISIRTLSSIPCQSNKKWLLIEYIPEYKWQTGIQRT